MSTNELLIKVAKDIVKGSYVEKLVDKDVASFLVTHCFLARKFVTFYLSNLRKDGVDITQVEKYLLNFWDNMRLGKGLIFVGPVGTGKTAALVVVLKYVFAFFKNSEFSKHAKQHFLGTLNWAEPIAFVEGHDLLATYFSNRSEFGRIIEKPAIGLDDITKVSQDLFKEVFDYVLRHRDMNGLPTFLTSQIPVKELRDIFGTATHDLLRSNFKEIKLLGQSKRKN